MFTGIIEAQGTIINILSDESNLHFYIAAPFLKELRIDQSIAHNGVCLTVVDIQQECYVVTAIAETIRKSNLGQLRLADIVNLERCMKLGDRLDGHIVQGHVDQTARCVDKKNENGSWIFTFEYDQKENVTVEKGSVCVNGVSLTVVNSSAGRFSVAIIPYTYENTNFHKLETGSIVNLEFDIIGKYIARLMPR